KVYLIIAPKELCRMSSHPASPSTRHGRQHSCDRALRIFSRRVSANDDFALSSAGRHTQGAPDCARARAAREFRSMEAPEKEGTVFQAKIGSWEITFPGRRAALVLSEAVRPASVQN